MPSEGGLALHGPQQQGALVVNCITVTRALVILGPNWRESLVGNGLVSRNRAVLRSDLPGLPVIEAQRLTVPIRQQRWAIFGVGSARSRKGGGACRMGWCRDGAWASAAVLGQPGRQISGAAEIEQRVGKRLKLLQRQGLDPGGGGLAEGAAATIELAEGDNGFAFGNQLLAKPGVAQVIGGELDQDHDFLAGEMGKSLTKDRENGFEQIGPWPQDLIRGAWDLQHGSHRQRQQAASAAPVAPPAPRSYTVSLQQQPWCRPPSARP
jgi:hypothetical protein